MTVGGHHDAAFGARQQGLVIALVQPMVVKGGGEDLLDELRHRAAPRAMRHVDAAMLEVQRANVAQPNVVRSAVHTATTSISRNLP